MNKDRLGEQMAKLMSAAVISGMFFVCKNPAFSKFIPAINVNQAICDNFAIYRTSPKTTDNAPDDSAVFNAEVVNELENESQPEAPTYEAQEEYNNRADLLNSDNVLIKNHTSYQVDAEKLMEGYSPPKKKKEPQILILHTHATEAFADQKSSRTTDTEKNVVKIGDALEKALEKKGFNVLHDIVLHDFPDYNSSYKNSLATANWYLEHYPEIDIVFDIHRDAIVDEKGSRTKLTYNYKNKKAAQLMIVSGTNQGGLSHNDWQENLKFAIGLQAKANELYSGLMRPIDLRVERFNGHVTNNALIIEFGTDGNTLEEALLSAELFADILGGYIK